MTALTKNTSIQDQTLSSLLTNASMAMADLGMILAELESQLFKDTDQIDTTPAVMSSLQTIDVLAQTIAEIGSMLERLESSICVPVVVDHNIVVSPIRLERLRKLIAGDRPKETEHASQSQAGNVAVFK